MDKTDAITAVIMMALAIVTCFIVFRQPPEPTPPPPCSCAGLEGCSIQHFEEAMCAVGPGHSICCEMKLRKL